MTTTTTTTTTTRTVRELPRLRTDHVHPALLKAEGFEIAALCRELRGDAAKAGNRWREARAALGGASASDTQAASAAVLAGKPRPKTRAAEAEATKAEDSAFRDAEAKTHAANQALAEVIAALKGAPGAHVLADVQERVKVVRGRIAASPDLSAADIAELGALLGFEKWLRDARNPHRVVRGLPSGRSDSPPTVHLGGLRLDPLAVMDSIRTQLGVEER